MPQVIGLRKMIVCITAIFAIVAIFYIATVCGAQDSSDGADMPLAMACVAAVVTISGVQVWKQGQIDQNSQNVEKKP